MSAFKHTPRPWTANQIQIGQGLPYTPVVATTLIAKVYSTAYGDHEQSEANARLIAAAPDHALVAHALCSLGARWEKWEGNQGEFCIGGFRYCTELDEFGVPVITGLILDAIANAGGES